jgi:alkanesulfonate monooxygenase SsuD/methylene tetrahydromethanopterin reductase-like flavin-dependent oxidoreductase (luciferase family)
MIQDDHDNSDNNIKSINLTVHINYTGSIIYYRIYLLHKHSKASSSYIHRYMEIIRSRHKKAAKYGDGWMASAYNITPDKFREKWNMLLSYRKGLGKDEESFENCVMSMFGYIDSNKDKVRRMVKDTLSQALGRPAEQLKNLLLFGSVEECIQKINALYEAGVKRIHFWPISDFEEQIEIFRKEIVSHY